MENIAHLKQRTVKGSIKDFDKNPYQHWLILTVCGLFFAGIILSLPADKDSPTDPTFSTVNELNKIENQSVADLDFSQKIKEQKSQQAFAIKAQASL